MGGKGYVGKDAAAMIPVGKIVWWNDTTDAPARAREFCKSRGLTAETARIVKRGDRIEVEIKKPCKLNVTY